MGLKFAFEEGEIQRLKDFTLYPYSYISISALLSFDCCICLKFLNPLRAAFIGHAVLGILMTDFIVGFLIWCGFSS